MNFKVLYLLKQNAVIYTCFVAAFVCCVAFKAEWGVVTRGMTRDSVKRECETFSWQRLTRVIVGWVTFRTWEK